MKKRTFRDDGGELAASTIAKSCLGILGGLLCIGAVSGTGWYMNYSTAQASLEKAGGDFMSNIPLYVESSLKHRLDPMRFHLKAGLSMLNTKAVDVATWDGIYQIRNYTTPFLQNFFGDTKCCYGVAVNMGFDKADVEPFGGWQGFLEAHPDSWGDDRMVGDVVLMDRDTDGNPTIVGLETEFTNGSNTNSWIVRPLDEVRYLPSVEKSQGINVGPRRFSWLDITWKTVHLQDLQPFQFSFTPIIVWDITQPYTLKTHGLVPLYENTRVPTEAEYQQFLSGRPPWNPGRRVGAWVIGFKLWFLSEHLANMNLKGGFIYLVERASSTFVASSDTSISTLAADENGAMTLKLNPKDVAHPMISGSAKVVAPNGDWSNIIHELKEVEVLGRRQFMLTFLFSYYNLELEGVYMVDRSIVLSDLDEMATQDALLSIVLNTFFSGVLVIAVILFGYQAFKRLSKIAQEQRRALHVKVQNGLACASEIAYPIVLVSAQDFLKLSDSEIRSCHEGLRLKGLLKFLDTKELLCGFKEGGGQIIFFSYEWQSWTKLGPSDGQMKLMRQSLRFYERDTGVAMKNLYVWLDILAIPQCHVGMKSLAVNSLYVYASSTSGFIVIAPEGHHENTGVVSNLDTYRNRVWTRVEQVAMFAANGLGKMYIAQDDGLRKYDMEFLKPSLEIFGAHMTCCRRKHEHQDYCDKESVILPVLGLWFSLLAQQRGVGVTSSGKELFDIWSSDIERYLPSRFHYPQAAGPTIQRPLFGNLIKKVGKIVQNLDEEELAEILSIDLPNPLEGKLSLEEEVSLRCSSGLEEDVFEF